VDLPQVVGIVAGMLTTVSFVPQVWRIWRRKSADDVSMPMFLLFTVGVAAWLVYGLLIHSMPVVAANVVTLVLAGAVIGLKVRYSRVSRPE
jgi:MtN3 and saliva related transmembrane protein